MEHLDGYSSSEDDSEKEECSEQESCDKKPDIESIGIYSQNFSEQKGMSSCFFYLPWKPSVNTLKRLKDVSNTVLERLSSEHPTVLEDYTWSDVKHSEMGHHLTILPNIIGKPYQIQRLGENIGHSIRKLKIDPRFVGYNPDELRKAQRLSRLTKSEGVFKCHKSINLKVEPKLSIFQSQTTFKIFLGIKIHKDCNPVVDQIQELVRDNMNLLGLKPAYHNDNLHHISIQIGDSKRFENMPGDTIQDIRNQLDHIDLSEEFKGIQVDVGDLSMYVLGKNKKIINMKFDLD